MVYEDFVKEDALQTLTDYMSTCERREIEGHTNDKAIHPNSSIISGILKDITSDIKLFIEKYYRCEVGDEVVGSIVAAYPGWGISRHIDTHDEPTMGQKTHSGFPSRDISTLLYLNSHGKDFTGGTLELPDQGVSIKPKAGMFVCFPSSSKYPHEATVVTSGERLNTTVFWHILKTTEMTNA